MVIQCITDLLDKLTHIMQYFDKKHRTVLIISIMHREEHRASYVNYNYSILRQDKFSMLLSLQTLYADVSGSNITATA